MRILLQSCTRIEVLDRGELVGHCGICDGGQAVELSLLWRSVPVRRLIGQRDGRRWYGEVGRVVVWKLS